MYVPKGLFTPSTLSSLSLHRDSFTVSMIWRVKKRMKKTTCLAQQTSVWPRWCHQVRGHLEGHRRTMMMCVWVLTIVTGMILHSARPALPSMRHHCKSPTIKFQIIMDKEMINCCLGGLKTCQVYGKALCICKEKAITTCIWKMDWIESSCFTLVKFMYILFKGGGGRNYCYYGEYFL